MKHPLSLALAAALFALPLAAHAQDESADDGAEESSIYSWNAAVTSDYVFRGVSQTDEEMAFQGGIDFNFDSGFYVGAWGSNVDFGYGGPDIEIDTYIGWNTDLTDSLNLDLMLNRYNYFGEQDGYGSSDYNEFIGALTYNEMWTFTLGYTNDVYALGEDSFYYAVAGAWELGGGVNLDASFGVTTFEQSTGLLDYNDWSIVVNKDFGFVNAALGYYDSDADGDYNFGEAADGRVVLTFSIGG